MAVKKVVVLGASSFVTLPLLAILLDNGHDVLTLSRGGPEAPRALAYRQHTYWQQGLQAWLAAKEPSCDALISLLPIWELAPLLAKPGLVQVERIVALSSSSVLNRQGSPLATDKALVARLLQGEDALEAHFAARGTHVLVLRPTMLFGYGRDKNISLIAHFLRRTRSMPLLGRATGLRQPVHAADVADCIALAVASNSAVSGRILLGGADRLPYAALVATIARLLGLRYLPLHLPRPVLAGLLALLNRRSGYGFIDVAMFDRMNQDLIVDNTAAEAMLNYQPSSFETAFLREPLING